MICEVIRKPVDRVDDGAFSHALRVWHELEKTAPLSLIDAVRGRCDAATNLYLTDLDEAGFWAYRMSIVNHSFSLEHTTSFAFGDYPDRSYFAAVVQPCFHDLTDAGEPTVHRVSASIQGKLAVYERLTLPIFSRNKMDYSVTLSKLLALVETPMEINLGTLSVRERQCLSLLAAGLSAKRIAADLQLSQSTVENHVEHLKRKLGARSVAHATAIAALDSSNIEPFSDMPSLSGRERQCLGYLASGLTVWEIAERLKLSAKTVELHVAAMKRKLAARNVAEAVALGIAAVFNQAGGTG